MKQQIEKFGFGIFALVVLMMAGFAGSSVYAQPLIHEYEFGPGAGNASYTLNVRASVPARTRILGVVVTTQKTGGDQSDIKVRADLISPQGSVVATRFGWAKTQVSEFPAMADPAGEGFISQRGCPRTWRIRLRTPNYIMAPARISGTVKVYYKPPPNVNLDIVGMPNVLPAGEEVTRPLTGRTQSGLSTALIAGTGIFSIRPNWTTGANPQGLLRVRLMKPNGLEATSQIGPVGQINLSYTVTPQDANMPGNWRLMVRNLLGQNITNFNLGTSSFDSWFLAECIPPPSIAFHNVMDRNDLLVAGLPVQKTALFARKSDRPEQKGNGQIHKRLPTAP